MSVLDPAADEATRFAEKMDDAGELPPSSGEGSSSPDATPKPIVLTGTVTDRVGTRVGGAGVRIRVTDARGGIRFAPVREGAYRIGGLEPGPLYLGCEAVGFRYTTRALSLQSAETEHREDFVLDSVWTIAIALVTPDGRNLVDRRVRNELLPGMPIEVVATKDPPGERLKPRTFQWRLAHRGSHYVPRSDAAEVIPGDPSGECSGRLEIFGAPPMEISAAVCDYVVATKSVGGYVDHLTIEIPLERMKGLTCGLSCRVADAKTLVPLPGVKAALFGGRGGGPLLESDTLGEIHKERIPPGLYTLCFQTKGFALEIRQLDLAPGRDNDIGTITLDSGITLRGRFVDPEGRPIPAEAALFPYTEEHPREAMNTTLQLGIEGDGDGRFEEEALARCKYLLWVSPFMHASQGASDWRAYPISVDLTRGPVRDLVIQVRPGVDLFLRPITVEARDLYYWVVTPDGLPCQRGGFTSEGDTKQRIAPGSYKLLLERDGSIVREIPFKLGEEPMTLEVDL